MNPLAAVASAVASVFNWLTGRSALHNAADVKAAQKAQAEENATAATNQAIAQKKTHEIQKELAE